MPDFQAFKGSKKMFVSNWLSKKILTIGAAVLVLAGCDGSSSSAPPPPPPPPPPPANVAPTADAGVDQSVAEAAMVDLTGVGTDSDGTIASYAWAETSGTGIAITNADMANASFTAPMVAANIDLVFSLTVTDDDGATGTDSITVTIVNNNTPPTADAGPDQAVAANDPVTLDGSGSVDADGTVDVYTWTQTAGTVVTLDETVPAMPTFAAPNIAATEVLTFDLVVTDNDAVASVADSVSITVGPTLALPFSDNFSDGNADGWTVVDDNIEKPSNWAAGTNIYVQNGHTNNFGGDVVETFRRGTYTYLTDSLNLTDYRLELDVRSRLASIDDIGVMFRYTDNDNYYRFTMNSQVGYGRLESKVNGTFMALSNNFRGYRPGELMQIAIEAEGSLIQIFVNGDSIFAANDSDHPVGGIAMFARDGASFDNVSVTTNATSPEIVIASPVSHALFPNGPRDVLVTAIARNVPAGGTVDVEFAGSAACDAATETAPGEWSALCTARPIGDRLVRAYLRDSGGTEVDRDTNTDVVVGAAGTSDLYDAFGDSITQGLFDTYRRDNLNLADQSVLSHAGWTGPLTDMLSTANSAPNIVSNEAVPGDVIRDLRFERQSSIFDRNRNPRPNRALVLIGTNNTTDFVNTPSGLGCVGAACDQTYNGDMQWVIQDLQGQGRDTVYVGLLPPIWGDGTTGTYDPADLLTANPATAVRSKRIIEFNNVIANELLLIAGVELGPDLFSCFLTATTNRYSMFHDFLHPNALGNAYLAALWADAILNGAVAGTCPTLASVYLLEGLDAYTHGLKQNLLEEDDEYYNDAAFTLTNVPAALEDGVWVTQSNADNANTDASFMSFDVGGTPVTVYIAYDPAGGPPDATASALFGASAVTLGVSDPAIAGGNMAVVEALGVTGVVTIGGTRSDLSGIVRQGYLVIVAP